MLKVEGRARSESAADTTTIGNATTVVEAQIPVTTITSTPPTPAIWVGGTNPSLEFPIDVSNSTSIKGCVLAVDQANLHSPFAGYDTNKMGSSKFVSNAPNPAYTFTKSSTTLPALPNINAVGNIITSIPIN